MKINTPEEWWDLINKTLPYMPEYASTLHLSWDHEAALRYSTSKEQEPIHDLFTSIYNQAPDDASSFIHPFDWICDICQTFYSFEKIDWDKYQKETSPARLEVTGGSNISFNPLSERDS